MAEVETHHDVIYVTADSSEWAILRTPDGWVSPPVIEIHVPMKGTVPFYYASCYQLPIPDEAKAQARNPL